MNNINKLVFEEFQLDVPGTIGATLGANLGINLANKNTKSEAHKLATNIGGVYGAYRGMRLANKHLKHELDLENPVHRALASGIGAALGGGIGAFGIKSIGNAIHHITTKDQRKLKKELNNKFKIKPKK